jgi:hypothetical protein|tara:strand:+ start:2470 stop:2664 length:195 start_codon:yes stop_codon:yes gene_type:complete
MQDLTNIVSISIHLARKNGEYPIMTEKQEAAQRGIIAWKRSNWAKMKGEMKPRELIEKPKTKSW